MHSKVAVVVGHEAQGSQVLQHGSAGIDRPGVCPQLSLCGQTIPFTGTSTFRFLGAPVTIHDSQDKVKSVLLKKLQTMISKVDATLLSSHQKLRLFRDAVCPSLT